MNPNSSDDVVAAAQQAAQSSQAPTKQFMDQFAPKLGGVNPPVIAQTPNPPAIEAVPQPKQTPVSILVQEITDALEKFKAAEENPSAGSLQASSGQAASF